MIAAVQLDQHTLSGHPLAAHPVLGWAPAPRTGQSGVDQDAPQGGPADGDTLALGQQLTEMRVVGTFVLRTSQPAGAGASELSLPVGKDQSYPAQSGVGRRHHLLAHGPGILYLVAIMDWHSRYVVAWRLSNSLEADFCVDALKEALEQGQPEVFNTDQATLRERRKMSLPHNGP